MSYFHNTVLKLRRKIAIQLFVDVRGDWGALDDEYVQVLNETPDYFRPGVRGWDPSLTWGQIKAAFAHGGSGGPIPAGTGTGTLLQASTFPPLALAGGAVLLVLLLLRR